MKSVIKILASVVLVISLLPTAAFADYSQNGLYFQLKNGSITVTGCYSTSESFQVPSSIAGYPVNTIATGAFTSNNYVKTIYLPDTITYIEQGAFGEGITIVYNPKATVNSVEFGGNYELVKCTASVGEAFTYNGRAMYAKDGAFYCVIASNEVPMSSLVAIASKGTAYVDVPKGDVNGNGAINIIDAQIAFDLANGVYSGFDALSADRIVCADENNDLALNALDARAIQNVVHEAAAA